MKQKIQFFLILGVVILGLAVFGYFKAIPGLKDKSGDLPKIEIIPKFFNFGEVKYGKVLEYSFEVKNLGKETLEIKRVATSCACTTAKVKKERLAPGEQADLLVKYDTGAMSGPHGRGKQERIIYVKSNDPINPQAEVMIYANVQ